MTFAIKGEVQSSMKKLFLSKMVPLVAGLMMLSGCIVKQAPPPAEAEEMPPPEVEVVPPQPDVTFVWTPGAWDWRGRWVWRHGYWGHRPHPGAVWVGSGWGYRGNHRVWVRGHWQ